MTVKKITNNDVPKEIIGTERYWKLVCEWNISKRKKQLFKKYQTLKLALAERDKLGKNNNTKTFYVCEVNEVIYDNQKVLKKHL